MYLFFVKHRFYFSLFGMYYTLANDFIKNILPEALKLKKEYYFILLCIQN